MADALISVVVEQLISYVQEEVNLVVGVREEVGDLTATLKLLQALLADAEKKQVRNPAVKVWLEELRDVVYAADDILDEWHTKTALSRVHRRGGVDSNDVTSGSNTRRKVLSFFLTSCYCFKRVQVRYDISHKIKEIRRSLDKIAAQRVEYGLFVSENRDEPGYLPNNLTTSAINASSIRGRQHDVETISNILVGESSHQGNGPVQVISIVGMGGLGKTTLARLVYSDEVVVKSFEKRMWVCVSEPFDRCRIAKEIIEQVDRNVHISNAVEVLHQQLLECLKGKKFLLVLDDVWTEDKAHWEPLKLSLDSAVSGSRIIITTRNNEVAKMIESTHTRNLAELSDEESWSVLSHVALKGREEETGKFEKIGRQIAVKCKGVPLTIQILARLLFERNEIHGWRDVLESDLWELRGVQDKVFSVLFMSFISLPSISKLCFLYCATFQKDTKMVKDVLIKLWMAQGFLGMDGTDKLENTGRYHFNVLAMRSFFQDFEKDSRGNIVSCKMHDLVHDFAKFLRPGECYTAGDSEREFNVNKVRHLLTSDLESPSVYEAKNLRTMISTDWIVSLPIQLFDRLSYLRALDLSASNLIILSYGVDKLLHLRYLDLSASHLKELPETICNLYNLQTLNLSRCSRLCKLPNRIGDLSNLRHLDLEDTDELSYLPQDIKRLSSLRTLCKFIVGGPNEGSTIKDLHLLNNLHGSLEISGLHQVGDANEAAQAELNKKRSIRALTFVFSFEERDDVGQEMEDVLEKLEPHEDLEELCIKAYQGYRFSNWMHNLDNIVHMKLLNCANCTELPALGNLASLEVLTIDGMDSVKHIGNKFYGFGVGSSSSDRMIAFPKLKKLEIERMENLEEWELPISEYVQIMPCLSALELTSCPKLRALPCLGNLASLEVLKITGMNSVKLIGNKFYGFGVGSSSSARMIAFPKLKELEIGHMENLEEWELPISEYVQIMPRLSKLKLIRCPKLSSLPGLGRLESLKSLYLEELPSVKFVGPEFLGISKDDADVGRVVSFPKLEYLSISRMKKLDHWNIPAITMPSLRDLDISNCSFF